MIPLVTLGASLAQILIPDLVGKLTKGKGRVVQEVASIALEATGLSPETPAADIEKALRADPEVFARVQEAAAAVAIAELEAEVKEAQISASDRADARKLYSATDGWAQLGVASVVVIGLFGIIAALIFVPIEETASEVITLVVGALMVALQNIISFFFGSSKGSKDKTSALLRRNDRSGLF